MSRIEVTVGNASVDVAAFTDSVSAEGTFPHYQPRDVLDAAAAALLAINTPQAVEWAHGLYELTAGTNR